MYQVSQVKDVVGCGLSANQLLIPEHKNYGSALIARLLEITKKIMSSQNVCASFSKGCTVDLGSS